MPSGWPDRQCVLRRAGDDLRLTPRYDRSMPDPYALAVLAVAIGFFAGFVFARRRAPPVTAIAEPRLTDVLADAPLLSLMLDPRGTVTWVSPSLLRLLDAEEAALLGSDWFAAHVPADLREGARQRVADSLGSGEPLVEQGEVETSAGQRRTIVWTTTPLRGGAGT